MKELTSQRFVTLDVFRGMTVCLMIIVNTQGSGAIPFTQMEHADWNGCTLTDLVFPSFLFAVGNAMVYANKKFEVLPERTVWYKIFKRSFLIFVIGYLLAWYPFIGWNGEGHIWWKPFSETRVMAVLQRIALAYLFAALIVRYASRKSIWWISLLLLLLYWALLYFFGDKGVQYTVEGNAVRKLDLLFFGAKHMFRERGIVFDPEGILSTIPAIVNVLAGYLVSDFILRKGTTYECLAKLLITSILLLFIGQVWNVVLPINKKLWTSSYVCYTSGIDVIVISLLFYWLQFKNRTTGVYFFTVFGKNPLFIYILSNLIGIFLTFYVTKDEVLIDWVSETVFQKITPGATGCLLFAISFMLLCWLAGWWMDKKKIYVRM